MKLNIRVKLSLMMFLQFFIWGGWFVTLGTFLTQNLDSTDAQSSLAYATQSWGAIVAPFIIGLIADKYINAERLLGFLHIVGAVLMYYLYVAESFSSFYPLVFIYMLLYMPTLALVNSVSFFQMRDTGKEFSSVRVFGSIGWVIAGLCISYFSWDSQAGINQGMLRNTFLMVAIASACLGIFSFALPKTPPTATTKSAKLSDILGLDALHLLKDRNFLMFFISSILICIPLAFYYQQTNVFLTDVGMQNATGKMTLGQISEIILMLLLPLFIRKYGIKKTLIVALLSWVLRYLLFAFGNAGELSFMLILGIVLHGICYDFFFVTGQIYTDYKAGKTVKSAAQGMITLSTYGVGMLVGFYVAGKISTYYTSDLGERNWEMIWLYPSAFAVLVVLLFIMTFKNEKINLNKTI